MVEKLGKLGYMAAFVIGLNMAISGCQATEIKSQKQVVPIKSCISQDLESKLLQAESNLNEQDYVFMKSKINSICNQISQIKGFSSMNDYEKFETIFYELWDNVFDSPSRNNSIIETLRKGNGTCEDYSSVMYLVSQVGENFRLDPKLIMIYNHVFVSFDYKGKTIDIDVINPFCFDTNSFKKRTDRYVMNENDFIASIHSNNSFRIMDFNLDKAIDEAEKGISMSPDFPLPHLALGLCYVKSGKVDLGIEQYKIAEKSNLRSPDLYNNLGVAYKLKKEFVESALYFKKALNVCRELGIKKNEEIYIKISSNITDLKDILNVGF